MYSFVIVARAMPASLIGLFFEGILLLGILRTNDVIHYLRATAGMVFETNGK